MKQFVLNALRETDEPLTSRQITEAWAEHRGLIADVTTINDQRKRITACIKACVKQGIVEECGFSQQGSVRGPYKLWRLKKGDL